MLDGGHHPGASVHTSQLRCVGLALMPPSPEELRATRESGTGQDELSGPWQSRTHKRKQEVAL